MPLNLMRPYLHRPRRPVCRDHDINPSSLGILAETLSSRVRDSQRVSLACSRARDAVAIPRSCLLHRELHTLSPSAEVLALHPS